jgi:peptidoglycan/xylan/chitin deacetylase (PgdA/CDA1 family)
MAGCGLSACLLRSGPERGDEKLPVPAEDSAIAGLEVRSFFNREPGREWKLVYGKGALEEEDRAFIQPPRSARLVAPDSNSTIIEKTLDPPANVCGDMDVSLKISAPSQANLISVYHMTIGLIGGPTLDYAATYNFRHLVREIYLLRPGQWSRINMSLRTFTAPPGFDCAHVSRVRIALNASPGMADTINLGQLSFYPSPLGTAALLITEDDEWSDFEDNGIPALREHGFPATIYANAGLIGTGTKMSLERLKTLQDSGGWTIANHLWVHDTITALSDDSAARSIRHNLEFLRDAGFTGYSHFAYPYGQTDRAKDSVVRSLCASARLTLGWPQGEALPFSDPYRLRVIGFLTDQVTLEMAEGAIRELVENRTAGMMGVHEIVAGAATDGNKWSRADWEALIDFIAGYVSQGRLKVYSLEGFIKSLPHDPF